jgi:TolA-binding protein
MLIKVENLERVIIDGKNAGDIVSVISNYPPEAMGEILLALQEWRNRYEEEIYDDSVSKAKSKLERSMQEQIDNLSDTIQKLQLEAQATETQYRESLAKKDEDIDLLKKEVDTYRLQVEVMSQNTIS